MAFSYNSREFQKWLLIGIGVYVVIVIIGMCSRHFLIKRCHWEQNSPRCCKCKYTQNTEPQHNCCQPNCCNMTKVHFKCFVPKLKNVTCCCCQLSVEKLILPATMASLSSPPTDVIQLKKIQLSSVTAIK